VCTGAPMDAAGGGVRGGRPRGPRRAPLGAHRWALRPSRDGSVPPAPGRVRAGGGDAYAPRRALPTPRAAHRLGGLTLPAHARGRRGAPPRRRAPVRARAVGAAAGAAVGRVALLPVAAAGASGGGAAAAAAVHAAAVAGAMGLWPLAAVAGRRSAHRWSCAAAAAAAGGQWLGGGRVFFSKASDVGAGERSSSWGSRSVTSLGHRAARRGRTRLPRSRRRGVDNLPAVGVGDGCNGGGGGSGSYGGPAGCARRPASDGGGYPPPPLSHAPFLPSSPDRLHRLLCVGCVAHLYGVPADSSRRGG